MYKVMKRFHDLQDETKTKNGSVYYEYNVGDTFPRKGKEVSEERIAELVGSDNRQREPLIALVEEKKEPESSSGASEAPPKKKTAKKKDATVSES